MRFHYEMMPSPIIWCDSHIYSANVVMKPADGNIWISVNLKAYRFLYVTFVMFPVTFNPDIAMNDKQVRYAQNNVPHF